MHIITVCFAFLYIIKCSDGQKYLSYVCHSFSSYWVTRETNSDCYYTGDVFDSFEKIAQFYGYNIKVFEVVTEDQYILKLFRISPMKSTSVGAPVLLVHGSFTAATAYTLMGNRSLAFLLADEGYDVWLSNFRGTSYSDKHVFMNSYEKKFWDFTFHEYGLYDLKSIIDFVSSTSKQKVIYMGWSIGARAYYVYNIMHQDEAIQKVRVSISLAPTVYANLMKTPFIKLATLIPYWIIKVTLDTLFPQGVFYQKTILIIKVLLHLCFDSPSQVVLCEYVKNLVTGFGIRHESAEALPVLFAQGTEATGVKMAYHTIQLIKSKKFQQFDYGKANNIIRYGTPNPPLYNLSLINVPIYIIYGPADFLCPEENAMLVHHELSEAAKPFGDPYRVNSEDFCHTDMVAAKDVKTLLYDHIIQFLKEKEVYFNN